jgi:hypothetical protein
VGLQTLYRETPFQSTYSIKNVASARFSRDLRTTSAKFASKTLSQKVNIKSLSNLFFDGQWGVSQPLWLALVGVDWDALRTHLVIEQTLSLNSQTPLHVDIDLLYKPLPHLSGCISRWRGCQIASTNSKPAQADVTGWNTADSRTCT